MADFATNQSACVIRYRRSTSLVRNSTSVAAFRAVAPASWAAPAAAIAALSLAYAPPNDPPHHSNSSMTRLLV